MDLDIKAILRERGLRQKDIAEAMGVSAATVSEWIAALGQGQHRRVPAERSRELATALSVPVSRIRPDLFGAPAAVASDVAA
jgi:transcriptional regulator with XRE-family HTH domain